MVDTYSLVLQSPSFDGTDGNGEQLPLPGVQWSDADAAMSTTLNLPDRENIEFGFARGAETISIQGIFTDANMSGENWRYDASAGSWETFKDAIHARDVMHRARKVWEKEDASGTWGSTGLPTEEQDSDTDRSRGDVRLILDKTYLTDFYNGTIPSRGNSLSLQFAFVYGTVQGFSGRHTSPSHRYRIPWQLDFEPVTVKFSFGGLLS